MGKIFVTEFVTLDGVMEDPGGSEKTPRGGWGLEFDRGPEGDKFKMDELVESEALLLGRVTYEGFAQAWPFRTGEFADKFNSMPKYVVSSTLKKAEWNNSHIIGRDFLKEIYKLKSSRKGWIQVAGSCQLVQALLEHKLVDEIRLMVYPVILGSGKRLFADTIEKQPLKLVNLRQVGGGITVQIYTPI